MPIDEMLQIRSANEIKDFFSQKNSNLLSVNETKFCISEVDINGNIRIKKTYRFDTYQEAENKISDLPTGEYQIQKIYVK